MCHFVTEYISYAPSSVFNETRFIYECVCVCVHLMRELYTHCFFASLFVYMRCYIQEFCVANLAPEEDRIAAMNN